ncbi:MiaB-like tRNA modifying enzyme [Candidatus Sulfotelmatobacter kueseliae]|uniref:MiaB-like tRNA modifying enzyme n=1 Tax=Candidatus Sulfotelmatobacter kueseliae TaxID=2042962 RepID=A0A2U3LC77_9BACT|nr:MiaB-like tRNA modifying enzyme [Candidatus Sulfotelmatobacter kueseliae]
MRYHKNVPGYYVENFGCRATQADGAALERQFEELGLSRASNSSQAAIVVLNTCTVTAAADQDARAAIRRIQRRNPEASIVVTGCYAQRAPAEIASLPGVTHVIGNSHKHQLAEIVGATADSESVLDSGWRSASSAAMEPPTPSRALAPGGRAFIPVANLSAPAGPPKPEAERPIFVSDIFAHTELLAAPVFDAPNERTRPNLKIQDGCDNRCSFCVIPYVRGQSRSLPPDRIIGEVNALVDAGYREIVLSGINLGRWGRDLGPQAPDLRPRTPDLSPQPSALSQTPASGVRGLRSDAAFQKLESRSRDPRFEDLIRAILAETSIEKLRISSVEPMDWTDDLIVLVASSARIAKHAHVPMQSASDAVLRRMHRKYRPWHYREKIEKIHAAMPTAAIGADVMVGFPGETDAEFEATRRMVEDLPFTYLHVFTYSARPGTPAASLPNQVPVRVARERNRVLRELAADKKLAFMRSFVGKEIEAITLKSECGAGECGAGTPARESRPAEFTEALTDNYLKLHLKGRHQPNRWLRAQVEDVIDGALEGAAKHADSPSS